MPVDEDLPSTAGGGVDGENGSGLSCFLKSVTLTGGEEEIEMVGRRVGLGKGEGDGKEGVGIGVGKDVIDG